VWGLQLGSGIGTYVPYRSFWLLTAALAASSPPAALFAGGAFGLTRQSFSVFLARQHDQRTVFSFLSTFAIHAARIDIAIIALTGTTALVALALGEF
jgi:hypothetical protein